MQADSPNTLNALSELRVALVGNPNSGKSTLFNNLTGLNQRTGNFPGVTVDKKAGYLTDPNGNRRIEIVDLPGTYSLNPKSYDEQITFKVLCDEKNAHYPDLVVIVADATNLKRSLLLCSQVLDLKIPVVFALNMMDLLEKQNKQIDISCLSSKLGVKVVPVNARNNEGTEAVKQAIYSAANQPVKDFIDIRTFAPEVIDNIRKYLFVRNDYAAYIVACNHDNLQGISLKDSARELINRLVTEHQFDRNKLLARETLFRYAAITEILKTCIRDKQPLNESSRTDRADKLLTHPLLGYATFLGILFLIFQSIFSWAGYAMDFIETVFVKMNGALTEILPDAWYSHLLTEGILAGLSGILVFVPQIALLFGFIAILEDSGYMARVTFIMDKMMRRFGLNGKSLIPLMSGMACAVPAIMSARTIGNWKERLVTIMVTPLMSCSARLPVYALLVSFIFPAGASFFGLNMQGLAMMGLYLLGFLTSLAAAFIISSFIKNPEKSYFIMEMPVYRMPRFRNVLMVILQKVKIFLFDAGKIIVSISIVLWFLSSYGPGNSMEKVQEKYASSTLPDDQKQAMVSAEKLENSYAGRVGKAIEPAIKPLGFDWKIGISLITSFAAREVFVGTMATIYSVGDAENTGTIRERMMNDRDPKTGERLFSPATAISLLFFYVFAMQCMSTIAVVYRETGHWKWPAIQFLFLSFLACFSSFLAYNLLK